VKLVVTIFLLLLVGIQSFACDQYLKKYQKDCQFQDRVRRLKTQLAAKHVNLDDVAEYRVLRFIDRNSWESAKRDKRAPINIYNPKPDTWQVWDAGIRKIFVSKKLNGILYRGFKLDRDMFSNMNLVLLSDGNRSIKDPITDQKKKPGQFRVDKDLGVGFCNPNVADSNPDLEKAKKSVIRFQQEWERKVGYTFDQLARRKNAISAEEATFVVNMSQSPHPTCKGKNSWVNYAPTADVQKNLDWMRIFIEANLQNYANNKAAMSPVELATFVQKWFVSIHPFSDGNGRTSRAVQDILLANFDLPFAPAGDLYIDATAEVETYIQQTYAKMDAMLTVLESCAKIDYKLPLSQRPFYCATTTELNSL
jgi:prophage maintenance system killer protein